MNFFFNFGSDCFDIVDFKMFFLESFYRGVLVVILDFVIYYWRRYLCVLFLGGGKGKRYLGKVIFVGMGFFLMISNLLNLLL